MQGEALWMGIGRCCIWLINIHVMAAGGKGRFNRWIQGWFTSLPLDLCWELAIGSTMWSWPRNMSLTWVVQLDVIHSSFSYRLKGLSHKPTQWICKNSHQSRTTVSPVWTLNRKTFWIYLVTQLFITLQFSRCHTEQGNRCSSCEAVCQGYYYSLI